MWINTFNQLMHDTCHTLVLMFSCPVTDMTKKSTTIFVPVGSPACPALFKYSIDFWSHSGISQNSHQLNFDTPLSSLLCCSGIRIWSYIYLLLTDWMMIESSYSQTKLEVPPLRKRQSEQKQKIQHQHIIGSIIRAHTMDDWPRQHLLFFSWSLKT